MPIFVGTLARYFGLRFLTAVLLVFAGIFALVTLVDYIELMRRAGDIPGRCPWPYTLAGRGRGVRR